MWPITDDQLREMLRHLPAVIYQDSHEPHPRTIYLSPNADTVLGSGADEHLRDPGLWWRSIDPRDHDDLMTAWTHAYETEEPYTVDYRYLRPDGRTVWLREHAVPVRGDGGPITHWQGMLLDVTFERSAVDELAASEARHRSLVEHLPAAVYTLTNDDPPRLVYVSRQVEELYGYPAERWVEYDDLWPDVIHPDDRDRVVAAWETARRDERPFERRYRIRHAEGGYRWIVDHIHPIHDGEGTVIAWEGMSFDVTREHDTAAALLETETRYERLLQQIPGVAFSLLPGSPPAFDYLSPRVLDILGYPPTRWLEESDFWLEVIHPDDRDAVLAAWEHSARELTAFRKEYRVLHADGSVVWLRAETLPVRGPDGDVERWQGLWMDVSEAREARAEQRRAQDAREAAEARARALLENVPAVVYEMGPDDQRRTLYVSPHIERLLGYTREEWLDQPDIWVELLHPDDRETELDAHDRQSASGEPWSREYRLIGADGRVVWVRDQATLVHDPEGRPSWQGVLVDVTPQHDTTELLRLTNEELERRVRERTSALEEANALMGLEVAERRRAEKEASSVRERYRVLVEHMPAVAYIWRTSAHAEEDPDADYYMSPRIEEVLGYTPTEWHDERCWIERLHPHDRDEVVARMSRCEETGEPFAMEFRYLAKDGRIVWIEDHATLLSRTPEGKPALFHGVMLDVTARKDAEEHAVRAEERFRKLAEESPIVTYAFSVDRVDPPTVTVEYVSPQIAELIGFSVSSWIDDPMHWFDLMHPDDRERARTQARTSWISGYPWSTEYRMIAADGRVVWLRDQGRCVERDHLGRPRRFLGTIVDVTVEAEQRERSREELETLRRVVAGIPAVTWIESVAADATEPRYLYISPQVEQFLGYDPEELLVEREHFPRLVHPDDAERIERRWLEACLRQDDTWEDRWRARHRDGRFRWVHARARRVSERGADPILWVGVSIDVTDEMTAVPAAPVADGSTA
jgi:PAS domain S-box-containing protein